MLSVRRAIFLVTVFICAAAAASAQTRIPQQLSQDDEVDGFYAGSFKGKDVLPYRLFIPDGYDARMSYPLIIWLHGTGGAGRDNWRQIIDDQVPGTHTWTSRENQTRHPAFVLAPQAPGSWSAEAGGRVATTLSPPLQSVLGLLDMLERTYAIDPHRVYISGQSDGGFGVWRLVTAAPERFAAAIVLCGGAEAAAVPRAASIPVWIFQGDRDPLVPVASTRQLVAALTKAGGHPKYTEYRGVGHEVWIRAFSEPGLVDWLFAQHN